MTTVSANSVILNSTINSPFSSAKNDLSRVDLMYVPFVNSVMNCTFSGCNKLTKVSHISNTVTNMYCTFAGCQKLTNAPTIPNSVIDMAYAFRDCSSLINAPTIPNSVTNMYRTFNECYILKNVSLPSAVTNAAETFSDCRSLEVMPELPNTITNASAMFRQCYNLTTIKNVPEIDDAWGMFMDCHNIVNTNVTIAARNCDSIMSSCYNFVNAPTFTNNVESLSYAFANCYNLVNITIPNSVTDLSGAFQFCTHLVDAPVIPNSVKTLSATFFACYNLTNAPVIPNSVESITSCFSNCTNLSTPPLIPNSVKYLSMAFSNTKITTLPTLPNGVISASSTFAYCSRVATVNYTIPESICNVYKMFENDRNMTGDISFSSGNIANAYNCFNNTTLQKNVYIPYNYTSNVNIPYYGWNTKYSAYSYGNVYTLSPTPNVGDVIYRCNNSIDNMFFASGYVINVINETTIVTEDINEWYQMNSTRIPELDTTFEYNTSMRTLTYKTFTNLGYDSFGTKHGVYLIDSSATNHQADLSDYNYTLSMNRVLLTEYIGTNNAAVGPIVEEV